jgi:biopolymer transport protein ExbD
MAASTRSAPNFDLMAEINITPFTDVLLVLLIIFMILAALTTPPGFQKQVAAPHAHVRSVDNRTNPIVIEVNERDRIGVDGIAVTVGELYGSIARAVERHEKRRQSRHIELAADAQASYNTIIKILDAARQAGDEDVGFVVR